MLPYCSWDFQGRQRDLDTEFHWVSAYLRWGAVHSAMWGLYRHQAVLHSERVTGRRWAQKNSWPLKIEEGFAHKILRYKTWPCRYADLLCNTGEWEKEVGDMASGEWGHPEQWRSQFFWIGFRPKIEFEGSQWAKVACLRDSAWVWHGV